MKIYAGIEAGGTKFICGIADGNGVILEKIRFPTTTAEETLSQVTQYFKQYNNIAAFGIGAFGPVCLDLKSALYGATLETPKVSWRHYNILAHLKQHWPQISFGFDTDVNAAALGEQKWGAAQGMDHVIYLTVGTGIGGGVILNNHCLHGLVHPEMGHILVQRSTHEVSSFQGVCPSHKNCLEGLASGPAINQRFNVSHSSLLPKEHIAWEIESDYLAQAVANYILVLSPQKVIMGGGVMKQAQLFPKIRQKVKSILNGYITHPYIEDENETFIVAPALAGESGLKGAIALAMDAYAKNETNK